MRGAALERDGMCRRLRADKNGRRALGSSRWWLRTYAANGSRPALGVFERAIKREGLKVSARTVERELARRVSVHEGWRSGPHAVLGQEPGGRRLSERSLDPAHRPIATGALRDPRGKRGPEAMPNCCVVGVGRRSGRRRRRGWEG